MKISSLLSHVGYVRLLGDPGTELTGITCDSREIKPGDLFVCLNGFHRDGHGFAGEDFPGFSHPFSSQPLP